MIRFGIIWINLIQVAVDVIRINMIQIYIIFVPKIFNFKNILIPRVFENAFAFKVFTFNFRCTIPLSAPIFDIRCLPDGLKDVESPLSGTGNLWSLASGSSRWVHTDAVIAIPPKSNSSHFSTTLHTSKGYFPITIYPYTNGSSQLNRINECIIKTHSSYCELFRTYSYKWKQYMFHPRTVLVFDDWSSVYCWVVYLPNGVEISGVGGRFF